MRLSKRSESEKLRELARELRAARWPVIRAVEPRAVVGRDGVECLHNGQLWVSPRIRVEVPHGVDAFGVVVSYLPRGATHFILKSDLAELLEDLNEACYRTGDCARALEPRLPVTARTAMRAGAPRFPREWRRRRHARK